MWAKISSALRPRHVQEDENSASQGEVISKVFEQHPNLSVFHQSDRPIPTPSPPASPSRNMRRSMFKRSIRIQRDKEKEDDESLSAPSLLRRQTLPRKMMSHFNFPGNSSQTSLSRGSADTSEHSKRSPSDSSRKSVQEVFQLLRPSPSLDPARLQNSPSLQVLARPASADNQSAECSLGSGLLDPRHGSVRSILRDPNTPGTGQNVRFFSRDAYRTISPDTSQEPDFQSLSPVLPDTSDFRKALLNHEDSDALASFFGGPDATGPASSSTPAAVVLARSASPRSHKPRPSLSEVFSPIDDERQASHDPGRSLDGDGDRPIPAPDFSCTLDTSEQMDGPPVPPGLEHEGDESAGNASQTDDDRDFDTAPNSAPALMISTSFSSQAKGKATASCRPNDQHSLLPSALDEKVFRPKENPHRPNPGHDRSHSFSFGQTVFFSIGSSNSSSGNNSKSSKGPASASSISPLTSMRPPFSESESSRSAASPTSSLSKGRSRALSDTIFHSRAMSPTGHYLDPGIDDEPLSELFSTQPAEPDPFSVHAKTYYTPQTMIPTTPPQRQHVRRTSKEENIIFSLQTQLTLQTELCGQYEADLRARDEMVEMLNNKLADLDKEENRKKAVLRTWRKKVQELERAVRHLEEELDDSRQESMERSIMDEASGDALRELHRQIAGLEREKVEWSKAERLLKEERGKVELLVKEKAEDVEQLKGSLWKKDEDEREWRESIGEAKVEIETMNNRATGSMDEELQRLTAEREQQKAIELDRQRAAETHWQVEKTELSMKLESIQLDNESMSEQLETLRDQMKARDEEYSMLRAELEAQWQHTEKASEKLDTLEKERIQLEMEKESLKRELTTAEERAASLEDEWHESEGRRNELENDLQEVWNGKQALEKERNQLEEQLQQEREQVDELTNALQERQDHIVELEQEHRFATENASRLEENLRHRDEEFSKYSIRAEQREAEIEQLREELSILRRSHSRELDEKARKVHEAVKQAAEATAQFEENVRIKADLEVENTTNKDRVAGLKEEVEKLRKQVHALQQDSADKEVKVVQMTKQLAQKEEDMVGLNIALDSKQQELELMKRRQGVRGTAGTTPARPSKVQRRDSSVLDSTPAAPRPSSVLSDSSGRDSMLGNHRKLPSDSTLTSSAIRISTLGKSTRVNSSVGPRTALKSEGSMGPPLTRPRVSTSTPTPVSRPSSISSLVSVARKPSVAPVSSRRLSSGTLDRAQAKNAKTMTIPSKGSFGNLNSSITSVSEVEEKENIAVGKRVPVPA